MTDEQYQSLTDEQIVTMTAEERQDLIAYWRRKCLAGEADINMTKRIVAHLRANRLAATTASAGKEKKSRAAAGTGEKKPKSAKAQAKLIDSDALLAGLEGL